MTARIVSRSRKATPTRDEWLCGYAAALADSHRCFHYTSAIKETLIAGGITLQHLKRAGVEAYDLDEIRKCLPASTLTKKRARERSRMTPAEKERHDLRGPKR